MGNTLKALKKRKNSTYKFPVIVCCSYENRFVCRKIGDCRDSVRNREKPQEMVMETEREREI